VPEDPGETSVIYGVGCVGSRAPYSTAGEGVHCGWCGWWVWAWAWMRCDGRGKSSREVFFSLHLNGDSTQVPLQVPFSFTTHIQALLLLGLVLGRALGANYHACSRVTVENQYPISQQQALTRTWRPGSKTLASCQNGVEWIRCRCETRPLSALRSEIRNREPVRASPRAMFPAACPDIQPLEIWPGTHSADPAFRAMTMGRRAARGEKRPALFRRLPTRAPLELLEGLNGSYLSYQSPTADWHWGIFAAYATQVFRRPGSPEQALSHTPSKSQT
jgi:hypothetical protein